MTAPLLTLLAEKDQIIDNGRVKAWLQRIPAQPSQLIEYPGMKHSILMEPCRGQALDDIRKFLGRVEKACSG
jgi:alpha-beta hydrolase superfamily lysophospholipase